MREKLIKTGRSKPNFYKRWGRFRPNCQFNVDQVPLPFVVDRKTTYEVDVSKAQKEDHKVLGEPTWKWARQTPVLAAGALFTRRQQRESRLHIQGQWKTDLRGRESGISQISRDLLAEKCMGRYTSKC